MKNHFSQFNKKKLKKHTLHLRGDIIFKIGGGGDFSKTLYTPESWKGGREI